MCINLKYVIINPMKILFITDLYPIKSGETATPLTLHNFVIEWIRQGHEVTVIKSNFLLNSFLRNKPFYPDGIYEFEGVKICNVNYFTPFLFNILEKVPKEVKYADYDVIIAHMPSGIIFANKMSKTTRIPLVCGVHASDLEVLTNPLYGFYFKEQLENAYKRAKKIACRSYVLQKKFCKLMPNVAGKTFVAPSGVNVKEMSLTQSSSPFMPNPPTHSFNPLQLNIVTCANLIKRKNVDKLINAINDEEGFKLTVIGDGAELENLKKIASEKVTFTGHLPHEKVLEEMKKADVFILPSVNETFGMVYLEAMASGCITVCTKNDGIDGIISDSENGFLTEPTVEGIKQTLLKIRNYPDKEKIIKNGLNTIKEYSIENCAKNYIENVSCT